MTNKPGYPKKITDAEKAMTVLFDFDGTLANSIDIGLDAYNEIAAKHGALPVTRADLDILRTMTYKQGMKLKHIRVSRLPAMAIAVSKIMKSRMHDARPYDDIVPVLKNLVKTCQIGIITSNSEEVVRAFLLSNDFPEFLFVWSEKHIFGKDKTIKKAIKRYKLDTNTTIYVGDEPRDVVAARKSGIRVIGVTWGLGGEIGIVKASPDYIAKNPQELLEIAKGMI